MNDDEFIEQFMARAKKRGAKLTEPPPSEVSVSPPPAEVTYPALSPFKEADDEDEDKANADEHDLNYSSDLSLDCAEPVETFRAEPVICHSSPLQEIGQQRQRATAPPLRQFLPPPEKPERERPDRDRPPSSQSLPTAQSVKQVMENMKSRAQIANQAKSQLRKAVEVSKHGSREHIEAARLLQITENEHLCYSQRAAKLELGEYQKPDSFGSLKLSKIELRMSSRLRNDLGEEGVSHYFFCVASCGVDVKATEVVDTNSIKKQDVKAYIQFRENLTFEDLPPDFNLKLEVFELIIGQHLPKLLSRLTPSKKSKMSPDVTFKRVGSLKLTLADRKESYKKLTQWSENEKSKYIESECKFRIELRSEQLPSKSGLLHVRTLDQSGKPDWSRFWVELAGSQLKFWKYKQDSVDGKRPNQTIEIGEMCSESVQRLRPDDNLYRPNSFVMYTVLHMVGGEGDTLFQRKLKEDPKYKIMRHQLAAETKEERDSWCGHLDKSMSCFREWHGNTRMYSLKDIDEMLS